MNQWERRMLRHAQRVGHVGPTTKQSTKAVDHLVSMGLLEEVKGPPWYVITDAGRRADASEPKVSDA